MNPRSSGLTHVDDCLEGVSGVWVEGDGALLVGLAGRDPKPRCAVGIMVEAVDGKPADFVAAGPGPASSQQRGPLERAAELLDGGHQLVKFVVRDEPWHSLRRLRRIAHGDQGVTGDVVVLPRRSFPEELGKPGDTLLARDHA